MRVTLTPRQRALLCFLSASGYTAWFSGLGEASNAGDLGAVPQPYVTLAVRPDLPNVTSIIARDPFAGKPLAHAANAPNDRSREETAAAHSPVDVAVANVPRASDGVVVPDIASRGDAAAATFTLVLRATIVGPQPVAYVANGTVMDIVRIGDTLGDRRVTKIDLRGIVFGDGTRLDLADNYIPTPQPARRPAGSDERISLETLRRLLLPAREQQASAPSAEVRATPQAAPSVTYPTPGPLPSIDMRGIPVGVNPTPDANGPTPYPNPYPYAPPAHH